MSNIKEELDQMLSALSEPKAQEPEPVPTPESTPEPETKEEPKPEPKVEEPKEEPQPESVVATPEPKVEPELPKAPESDERDKTITDLRTKIAELEAKKTEPPKVAPKEEPITFEDKDFAKDIDLDELSRDPALFNKAMNKVYQQAVSDAQQRFSKSLPDMVTQYVTLTNDMRTLTENFYKDNSDLKSFNKVVSVVFEEIAAKDPNKTYADIMSEVAPEVRKRLDLPQPAAKSSQPTKSEPPPQLPKKGSKAGRLSETPTVNPLQAELDEMTKVLGR